MLTSDKDIWSEIECISQKMLDHAKSYKLQISSLNAEELTCKPWLDITDLNLRRMTLLTDFFNSNEVTNEVVFLKKKIKTLLALDKELTEITLSLQNGIRHQSSLLGNQYRAATAYESIQTS